MNSPGISSPRVALVHDWLNQMGGAENVLLELTRIWPEAPIYTSIFDPAALDAEFEDLDVRTSFMQVIPGIFERHRVFLPVYAGMFARWWIPDCDLIISNASGFCRWIPSHPSTTHVCYCLTPPRYLWDSKRYLAAERDFPPSFDPAVQAALAGLRRLDVIMADRTDDFIAISTAVAERIARYYGRPATVIYPPVRTADYAPAAPAAIGEHFLLVSRLAPYKRIDLAIRACNRLGVRLRIVGSGRAESDLQAIAGKTIEFAGRISSERLRDELARCRALIFPGEEDFGLVPVEAQAAGRPVVAFAGGGALETVRAGVTGEFFHHPTTAALADVLASFDESGYDPAAIRENAERFGLARFRTQLTGHIQKLLG